MRSKFLYAASALVIASSLALPAGVVLGHPGFGAGGSHPGSHRMAGLERLELSDAQRDAIQTIVSEERASLSQHRHATKDNLRDLRTISPEDPDYFAAVEEAAALSAELARERVLQMGRMRYRIYTEAGLSEAQKQQFDSARERRRGRVSESDRPHADAGI